ncbi:hypothetical protein [Marinoscillum sp. MHG1-6]|uniref:hypothetical protein n=1 Tax=Marinoscillum sp. MHG1-6 TaxID=2959627 RepID=UPI002157A06B|nr:hypothetical protein [Marinoscillum sp. MHG1-6]
MDFSLFNKKLAKDIKAEHTEYDANHSVFIVPLKGARFQTVIAQLLDHPKFNKKVVKVSTKICYTSEDIDYPSVLAGSADFVHTRFIVEDDLLKAEASFFFEAANEKIMKEMILEVANTADEWEFKITGKDVF